MVVLEDSVVNEGTENTTSVSEQTFSVEILKIIKEAQQQHGLRHGDYQRYRGYCSRRIRRLRKVLHVTQGDKRHFKKKEIRETLVKDEKFLHIPLMMAERAWGYAMQLRQESNTEPRKKFHLVSRLRKATTYALQLQKLCEGTKCDARTKLEAQAYVAWIHGSLHFELQLWMPAMENLKKAQMVYEKLAPALAEDDQVLYRQRVEELSPSLRYCAYNIGDESAIDDLLKMRSHGQGDLLANLDSLLSQARERRAEVLHEVQWRGHSFAVRPERVRLFLISEQELDAAVEGAVGPQEKVALLESLLLDCKDAIAAARDEQKDELNSKGRAPGGIAPSPMQMLLTYLTYIRLMRTVQRTLLMVEAAHADRPEGAATAEGRRARPRDLTRLYEMVLQNLSELQQLPGLEEDLPYQQELEARVLCYKAFRCFHMAQSLAALRRWPEAMALYTRAEQHVQGSLSSVHLPPELRAPLQRLQGDIAGEEYAAHAHSVLEGGPEDGDSTTGTSAGTGASSRLSARSKKPLAERLAEYREDAALTTRAPNVFRLPPDMQPIPCKPLFFDLAFNWVEFPSLEDRLETAGGSKKAAAGLTGFVKGLWGWGSAKQ